MPPNTLSFICASDQVPVNQGAPSGSIDFIEQIEGKTQIYQFIIEDIININDTKKEIHVARCVERALGALSRTSMGSAI